MMPLSIGCFSRYSSGLLLCVENVAILCFGVCFFNLLRHDTQSCLSSKSINSCHHPGVRLLPSRGLIKAWKPTFFSCESVVLCCPLILLSMHLLPGFDGSILEHVYEQRPLRCTSELYR